MDQDALDFLKQFFNFKDPDAAPPAPSEPGNEIYFRKSPGKIQAPPTELLSQNKPKSSRLISSWTTSPGG